MQSSWLIPPNSMVQLSWSRRRPEVSVIVPARNEEVGLADCLRSLVGQAGQTARSSWWTTLDRRDACDCGELSGSRDYGRSSAAGLDGQVQCSLERRENRKRQVAALHRCRHPARNRLDRTWIAGGQACDAAYSRTRRSRSAQLRERPDAVIFASWR